jgi:hypothetical protein
MSKILERHSNFITQIRRKRKLIKKSVKESGMYQEQAKIELVEAFTMIGYNSADDSVTDQE